MEDLIRCDVIIARIAEIEAEREQFVAQANQQIAAYAGALAALRALLDDAEKQTNCNEPDMAGPTDVAN